jgi:hypothetical protein
VLHFPSGLILDLHVPADFRDAVSKLAEMAVRDVDEDVRTAGVVSLTSLAQDGVVVWHIFHLWYLTASASQVSRHQHVSLVEKS